jgi:oxygen-independent coproporphyrinogen III oxidase
MPLGLYLSVPFCRTKCSYCNFASDVFSRAVFQRYVDRVCSDIERANSTAEQMGSRMERAVDSVYLGGGTPTVLDISQLERLFVTISQNFDLQPDTEITVECAPGTLTPALLKSFQHLGVNRVSLGVQSFVDEEARAVGRLHNRLTVLDDVARLREAGISNINIDLIAGLPHQTAESWEFSVEQGIASGAPHASVYMLEVDEDSRLGRELIAGGTRYHAHFVPDEELTADFYEMACQRLELEGVRQYEISNFAKEGRGSRHNLKYWTRQPYVGFGVDAHSMLEAARTEAHGVPCDGAAVERHGFSHGHSMLSAVKTVTRGVPFAGMAVEGHGFSHAIDSRHPGGFSHCGADVESVRFSAPDSLEEYVADIPPRCTVVSQRTALEETFFLGLRLNRGVDLQKIAEKFGKEALADFAGPIAEFIGIGLIEQVAETIGLTPRGRLLSNEVFERFISVPQSVQ